MTYYLASCCNKKLKEGTKNNILVFLEIRKLISYHGMHQLAKSKNVECNKSFKNRMYC